MLLAILIGRFPALRDATSLLSLVAIVGTIMLGLFLGLFPAPLSWLWGLIAAAVLLVILLVSFLPPFPHVSAWVRNIVARTDQQLFKGAAPQRINVNLTSPPSFFDPVTREPLIYYSRSNDEGYKLWNAPGHDPDTGETLQPVTNSEMRATILQTLFPPKAIAIPQKPLVRAPRRLEVTSGEPLPPMFDQVTRSNKVWIWGSRKVGYKLYDGPGFDETTGDPLIPVTTPEMVRELLDWKREMEETEKERPTDTATMPALPRVLATNVERSNSPKPDGARSQGLRDAALPPLIVSARLLPASNGWRLFLMNNSKSNLNLTLFKEIIGGVEYISPYRRRLSPGEREFISYEEDFKPGDELQIICTGFDKPYTYVFR